MNPKKRKRMMRYFVEASCSNTITNTIHPQNNANSVSPAMANMAMLIINIPTNMRNRNVKILSISNLFPFLFLNSFEIIQFRLRKQNKY